VVIARELRNTMASMQRLLATLNSGASSGSAELTGTLQDLRRSMQRVDQLLVTNGPTVTEAVRGMRGAAVQADSLTRVLAHASAQFDTILTKVNSGAGPAAALLNDSTVVRDLMQTNAALRELLVDLKANPGRYIRLRL
jgi:ABC-type transporter Mla subunit MlaD